MKRLLVCSDIHGELEKLQNVLDEANYDPKQDQLILLGDYIDRGPCSKEVIKFIMELVEEGAIALKGNHEDMFIQALESREEWKEWESHVGRATIQSYEGDKEVMCEHAYWMRSHLEMYMETDNYIFVHAGLEPETPLEWQDEEYMMWSRHYEKIGLGKLVIHGHTPVPEVQQIEDQLFIDTGASMGGKLTLLELPSMRIYED